MNGESAGRTIFVPEPQIVESHRSKLPRRPSQTPSCSPSPPSQRSPEWSVLPYLIPLQISRSKRLVCRFCLKTPRTYHFLLEWKGVLYSWANAQRSILLQGRQFVYYRSFEPWILSSTSAYSEHMTYKKTKELKWDQTNTSVSKFSQTKHTLSQKRIWNVTQHATAIGFSQNSRRSLCAEGQIRIWLCTDPEPPPWPLIERTSSSVSSRMVYLLCNITSLPFFLLLFHHSQLKHMLAKIKKKKTNEEKLPQVNTKTIFSWPFFLAGPIRLLCL